MHWWWWLSGFGRRKKQETHFSEKVLIFSEKLDWKLIEIKLRDFDDE